MATKKFQKTAVSINSRTEVIVLDSKFITRAVKSQVILDNLLPYIEDVVSSYCSKHGSTDDERVVNNLKYVQEFLATVVNTCDDTTEEDM